MGLISRVSLATAVLIVGKDLRVRDCNERATMLFGRSLKNLKTQELAVLLPALPDLVLQMHKSSGGLVSAIVRLAPDSLCAEGRFIAAVTELPEGDFVLELTDAERSLQLETQNQKKSLSEASRVLLRNLAHEVKNPLGGIRGAAQLLESELDSPDLREYTDVIISEVDRLQELVDRLLTPYRKELKKTPVNVHEVLEHVRNLVSVQYGSALVIERDYDVSAPDVMADREKLVQVFLNLVQNAAQALTQRLTEGDARIRLVTRVERSVVIHQQMHRLALCIDVQDNGTGVPDEIADKIFYPLVTTKSVGTGLGLPLAKTYIEQHMGDIELINREGWTDFRVMIPLEGRRL